MSFAVRSGESITTTDAPQSYLVKLYPLVWTATDASTYDVDIRLNAVDRRAYLTYLGVTPNRIISSCDWAPDTEPTLTKLQSWATAVMELATGKTSAP
jgi:hypothetical protein